MTNTGSEQGYTLMELMIAVAVLLTVSSGVMGGVFRVTKTTSTISNRTEMHSGVRNATELMQQEVGQAGRVALPNRVQLAAAVAAGTGIVATVQAIDASGNVLATANGTDSMFAGEQLVIDSGPLEETVTVSAVSSASQQITATFTSAHAANARVAVYGGFSSGVVPTTVTNGSTGSVLKMFGDINGDGKLQYVEYTCDAKADGTGNLYRRSVSYNQATKPALAADQSLLNNIKTNPDGSSCFTYQQVTVNNVPYVIDVAITLTVQTPDRDPVTGLYETETKALLNVAPRNVFNVWQLAGLGINNRIQPMPATVQTLLGLP